MKGLDGKVAMITGGGKGVGRSIALALGARGVRILVTGRDERALGETVGEIVYGGGKARHWVGDVRDAACGPGAVDRAFEVFGGLDFVVANAGLRGTAQFGKDFVRAEAILATNVIGTYATFDAAIAKMKGPGRLLATHCALGGLGDAGLVAYEASREGVLGLVRATARELAPKKITCNAIVSGPVDTERNDLLLREIAASTGKTPDAVKAEGLARTSLGRYVDPEEIAELVVFLCSSAADAISGQAIAVGA